MAIKFFEDCFEMTFENGIMVRVEAGEPEEEEMDDKMIGELVPTTTVHIVDTTTCDILMTKAYEAVHGAYWSGPILNQSAEDVQKLLTWAASQPKHTPAAV